MARKKSGTTDFFSKVGDKVLGTKRLPAKVKSGAKKIKEKASAEPKAEVPSKFRRFFEQRHIGWPEYVMLKAQLIILSFFAVTVVYVILLPQEVYIFIPLLLAISAYMAYFTRTQVKRAFKNDYSAYRSFMAMTLAIAWVFILALRHSPIPYTLESAPIAIIPPLLSIFFVVAVFTAFRLKYGRNYTFGEVQQVHGRRAVALVGYDIRSNVKAGLYPVESFIKVKRGDKVKLSVERALLGLRGAKIGAIIEKTQTPTKAASKAK